MWEFYSLGEWLGECFMKVNEKRPHPFQWQCPSLSACYPITRQKCKSVSFCYYSRVFFPPPQWKQHRADLIPTMQSEVLWKSQVTCFVYYSMWSFKRAHKLLWMTSLTSFCQTEHVIVTIQFVSVWRDKIKRSRALRFYKLVVKKVQTGCAISLFIRLYKLWEFPLLLCGSVKERHWGCERWCKRRNQ